MKIATVLSVSAVFALTSFVAAVGCSAPEPAAKDKSSASAQNDEDEEKTDGTTKPGTTTSPGTTKPGTTTTKPGTTTPPAGDNGAACLACVGSTTKAGLAVKCEMACKDGDEACFAKCDTENCGADGAVCKADFDKCAKECDGGSNVSPDQEAKYQACIAKNPKAKQYSDCADKCDNATCAEKCFTDAKCDDACDTAVENCEKEAGIPQN